MCFICFFPCLFLVDTVFVLFPFLFYTIFIFSLPYFFLVLFLYFYFVLSSYFSFFNILLFYFPSLYLLLYFSLLLKYDVLLGFVTKISSDCVTCMSKVAMNRLKGTANAVGRMEVLHIVVEGGTKSDFEDSVLSMFNLIRL